MRLALLTKTTIKLDKYMRQLFSDIEQHGCNFQRRHMHEGTPLVLWLSAWGHPSAMHKDEMFNETVTVSSRYRDQSSRLLKWLNYVEQNTRKTGPVSPAGGSLGDLG